MRIAFDDRVLDWPALRDRGIGRYAACLLDALRGHESVEVLAVRALGLRRRPSQGIPAEALDHLLLGRASRRAGAALLHAPAADLAPLRPGLPLVVTLHDLVPLKRRERYLRTGLRHRLRYAAVGRATRVIVPSQAVATDAERLLGVPSVRLAVVAEAPADVFGPVPDPRRRLERLDLPERFMLWVGGLDPPDPRKGVATLAAAVARRDGLPVVLAGRTDGAAERLASPGRVWLAGRVSDAELAALYSAAEVLVVPSDDEGYGLPAIEALACGTPVAAYRAGALPETLAGASGTRLVDRGDLTGLLEAAHALAGSSAGGPGRTWSDVARETVAVYRAAAEAAGGPADRPGRLR